MAQTRKIRRSAIRHSKGPLSDPHAIVKSPAEGYFVDMRQEFHDVSTKVFVQGDRQTCHDFTHVHTRRITRCRSLRDVVGRPAPQ